MLRQRIGFAVACLAAVACAPADDGPPADTAAEPLVQRWELGGDDAPHTIFTRAIVRELPDGRVLVADQGAKTLRIFGADGGFVQEIPVDGDGPGEVRAPFRIALAADTVFLINDGTGGQRPIGWIALSTQTRGTTNPVSDADQPRFSLLDRMETGAWLVRLGSAWRAVATPPPPGILVPDSLTIGIHRPGATDPGITWLPRFHTGSLATFEWPDSPVPTAMHTYVYDIGTLFAVSERDLWVVDARTGQGERWRDGAERVDVPLPLGPPASFDVNAVTAVHGRAIASARTPLERNRVGATHDPRLLPATAPLAASLVPAFGGRLWLERFEPDASAPRTWIAVDSAGSRLGAYRVPGDVRVQAVGRTLVVGVRTDSLGVEHVVAFDAPGR